MAKKEYMVDEKVGRAMAIRYLYYLGQHDEHVRRSMIEFQTIHLETDLAFGAREPGVQLSWSHAKYPDEFVVLTRSLGGEAGVAGWYAQYAMNELNSLLLRYADERYPPFRVGIIGETFVWQRYSGKFQMTECFFQLERTLQNCIQEIKEAHNEKRIKYG